MPKIFFFIGFIITSSCQHFIQTAPRPELNSEINNSENENLKISNFNNIKNGDKNFNSIAYELGLDPDEKLSDSDKQMILNRRHLRQLEKKLDSPKERINYAKLLPYFKSDLEKIKYLNIESIEGRQAWVNRNQIWKRQLNNSDYVTVAEAQDIAVGMTQELVKKAWGEPTSTEVSGNSIYRNEKWKYVKEIPTSSGYKKERRAVFFEHGLVTGWETY